MGIIFEFKDYCEVHEALDMVNEGLLGNILNKIGDFFKGISGQADKEIASAEIDKLIDSKTGELTPEVMEIINSINPQPVQGAQPAQQSKTAVADAFKKLSDLCKSGMYFKQNLKFMEDGFTKLMDQAAADKAGVAAAAKTVAASGEQGGAQTGGMEKVASAEMEKRATEFTNVYNRAKANLKQQVQAKMAALLKKSKSESTKLYINNRFATCETVLLLIEYNIKKLRLGLKGVDSLKKQMAESYKLALTSAKALQAEVAKAKAEGGMTKEVFKGLDITAFVKEFEPSQVTFDAEGKSTPADAKELFVYPYEGDRKIIIIGYDVNAKTVSFRYVDDNMKILPDATEPVEFEQFKDNLLTASGDQPPIKQKGNQITKGAPNAKPEEPAAEPAAQEPTVGQIAHM